ncbi:hypothetical protein IMS62_11220 [Janthinobacterium sp. GW458P]|uniref:hypothetical protein n=1 Tax=Janthinobacterium sp. GW458P TaxID=1981504 RepID=UPI001865A8F2|nr:hypothetical protein [Janthinobacterium sp. GW458P]MBE3025246.1 hypothetical protein [Janthinobacterium sp. GW458P]
MTLLKSGDGHPRGPTLLAGADTAATQAGGNRILSRLEHGGAPPATVPAMRWRPGRRHWTAGAVLLATLTIATLAYETAGPPAPPAAKAPVPASVAVAVPAIGPPAPQAVPRAAQAATIVNETAPAAPPAPAVASAGAPRRTAPPERQAAARAPASRPAARAPGDSDVALLTALVAHAHRQEGAAKPLRDVVVRKDDEETSDLLQRCKQLGMIEGMLCRARICSGRWDSDPACH